MQRMRRLRCDLMHAWRFDDHRRDPTRSSHHDATGSDDVDDGNSTCGG